MVKLGQRALRKGNHNKDTTRCHQETIGDLQRPMRWRHRRHFRDSGEIRHRLFLEEKRDGDRRVQDEFSHP